MLHVQILNKAYRSISARLSYGGTVRYEAAGVEPRPPEARHDATGGAAPGAQPDALTEHARAALRERDIPVRLLENVLAQPALKRPDRSDAELENWYASVPSRNGRILKVVLAPDSPLRVVTVYFDRAMRGQL